MAYFSDLQKMCHKIAVHSGWWEEWREIPELLMLCVTELAEAMEAYRINDKDELAVELADTVIRIMDMAEAYEINLEQTIIDKCDYNRTRPYRHGGKKA
jgi:NTP pyrophosphatase (non-canonical NTP hydrolase)